MPDIEADLRRDFPVLYHQPIDCGAYVPAGWVQLVRELSDELELMAAEFTKEERPVVQQIKEKFGGLRFYISHGTKDMHDAIARAEERADSTCERCGQPGSGRMQRGWMSTMCGACYST